MRSSCILMALALISSAAAMPFSNVKEAGPVPIDSSLTKPFFSRSHAGHLKHHGRSSEGRASGVGSRSAGGAKASPRGHALGKRSNKKRCTKKSSTSDSGSGPLTSGSPKSTSSSASSASATSTSTTSSSSGSSGSSSNGTASCFPALDFNMPSDTPSSSDDWWCDQTDEYAFLGFSYDVGGCPSLNKLRADFKDMRQTYNSRYVRSYNSCDQDGFNDKLVKAAWENELGIHALIFFGYDGDDSWKGRKTQILNTMKSNPRAPYVIRSIVVGSEPMFDYVLPAQELANQIIDIRSQLKSVAPATQVTLSDMPWAYSQQTPSDRKAVIDAVDVLQGNILPFFDQGATTAAASWSNVLWNINYFKDNGNGKKILMTQTGWPSNTNVWPANSANAKTSVSQEKDYFDLLDSKCSWMKKNGPDGGVGWFAHIYEENSLPGWGVVKDGKPKFDFKPQTSC